MNPAKRKDSEGENWAHSWCYVFAILMELEDMAETAIGDNNFLVT